MQKVKMTRLGNLHQIEHNYYMNSQNVATGANAMLIPAGAENQQHH